jgi:hypothetical protein
MFAIPLLISLLLPAQAAQPLVPAPFTAERFREHVAYLASDELAGRDVGSAGSQKAIDYLVRHLKASGLRGIGSGGSWFQDFPYATRFTIDSESRIALSDGASLVFGRDFLPHFQCPNGHAEGDLAFVGYGLASPTLGYDDFRDIDLKGKIALLLAARPPGELAKLESAYSLDAKWKECERHGASGVLIVAAGPLSQEADVLVPGGAPAMKIPWILVKREAAQRLFPSIAGNRESLAELEKAIANDGKPKPQSRVLAKKINIEVKVQRTAVAGRNVVGVFDGKGDLAKEAIIVSSHHDHLGVSPQLIKAGKDGIFNGADDNASGCAALLLLAEALHADLDHLPKSYRTVIFASFDAEERGLLGSRHYVTKPLWQLEKTALDINFDMVGRLRDRLLASDSESNEFLVERIKVLAPQCGLRVETRLHGALRADNASFMERAIPSVHFNTGLHEDYHQVSDEVSRINAAGGARVSWLAYRVLRETMEFQGKLRYRQPSPAFDIQSILAFVFKLGIVPEQNAQSGRSALVRFVMPRSIAAKHGLKSGDEIVGINGVQFESLIDAATAFSEVRLDRDLDLMVQRDSKRLAIKFPKEVFKDMAGPSVKSLGEDRFEVLFRVKPATDVKSVALAGTFNDWKADTPLAGPDMEGYFSTRLTLKAGVYEYKFVVNGKTWLADPTNYRTKAPDGNSVLMVGNAH